jgi:hypothetical protein
MTGSASRWFGVGCSSAADTEQAAREAATAAVAGREPALLVAFSSTAHDLDVVPGAVRRAAGGGTPLIGGTTGGEIAGEQAGSGRLVVVALGGPGLSVRTARGSLKAGARAAGVAAAAGVHEVDHPHRTLVLLSDGLAGERSEIVRGAYSVAGATVPLVGGGAADDLAMTRTHQFFDDEVLTDAVVAAALGSEAPIGVGIGHGWRKVGEPMVVTDSSGEHIRRLDDLPAIDRYLERLGIDPARAGDPDLWKHTTLMHPLGLSRPGGEEVRAIIGVDYSDRSLFCSDVPQGTMVWVMEGDVASVMDGTTTACDRALAMLGEHPPIGMIAFDCVARRAILGEDGLRAEVAAIAGSAPGVPVAGFYTYGEFARTRGSRGVHNATLVMLALA